MPTSLTPPPADVETECGNCGAYVYHGLMKCPNCGVYLVDPVDTEAEEGATFRPKSKFALAVEAIMRKLRGEPLSLILYLFAIKALISFQENNLNCGT